MKIYNKVSKLRFMLIREPNIGCAAAHPAHPLPPALMIMHQLKNYTSISSDFLFLIFADCLIDYKN